MEKFLCPRCAADPQPEGFGSPRNCAFNADGSFNPQNWNCETLNVLLGDKPKIVHGDDEQCEITPTYLDTGEDDDQYGGYIVTTRYKRRGRTDSVIYVGMFHPPLPITFAFVERVIQSRANHEVWRQQYGMPDEDAE